MKLSSDDRNLIASALRTFAAAQRRSAPQPTTEQSRAVYKSIMGRAVEADRLRKRIEK